MKSYRRAAAWAVAVVALGAAAVAAWRSEPVQRAAVPERYWSGKVVVAEIQLERIRDKATECAASIKKLESASPPGLKRLCLNYNEELERAVEDVVAVRAALRSVRE